MLNDGAIVGAPLKVGDDVTVGEYVGVPVIEGLFEGGRDEHPQHAQIIKSQSIKM